MEVDETDDEGDCELTERVCRSVLVTGASRGVGLGLVEGLAAMQPPPEYVIASCRNPKEAKELKGICKKHGGNIKVLQLDVTNEESRQSAVRKLESLLGEKGLNCLINNAAVNTMAGLEQVTPEMMRQLYETNTVAPLMLTKAFLPLLKRAAKQETDMGWHRGLIVNMSCELSSLQPAEEKPDYLMAYPYRISKTALNMVTKSLAMDLKSEGILCMSLNPGWVKTDTGGCNGELNVSDVIPSMIKVLGQLSEKDNGTFQDYKGETVPW